MNVYVQKVVVFEKVLFSHIIIIWPKCIQRVVHYSQVRYAWCLFKCQRVCAHGWHGKGRASHANRMMWVMVARHKARNRKQRKWCLSEVRIYTCEESAFELGIIIAYVHFVFVNLGLVISIRSMPIPYLPIYTRVNVTNVHSIWCT